jgi:exopolysaccharide biosynthesis polyprenyl glycosylphosphotransferase
VSRLEQTSPVGLIPDGEEDVPRRPPPVVDIVSEQTRELIRKRRSSRAHRRGWMVKRALAAADVAGLVAAFLLAEAIFGPNVSPKFDRFGPAVEFVTFFASLPLWLLLARAYHLYDRDEARTDHSTVDDLVGIFNMLTVGTWGFFAVTELTGLAHPVVLKLVQFWGTAILFVAIARVVARALSRRTDSYVQNTLIVGAGDVGQQVAAKLLQHPEYGVNVAGFIDDNPRTQHKDLADLTILGPIADLREIVHTLDIERVIIAFSRSDHTESLETIRELNGLDVQVDIVPRLFEVVGPRTTMHGAEGIPLLGLAAARLSWSSIVLKRATDLTLASIGLFVLAPFLALVALAIKLDSRGPVLFRQVRIGQDDRPFKILKFRTMSAGADERKHELVHLNKHAVGDDRMFKIPDDPRITRVGRLLRRYSLDELPQLINVLKGEMSLVGPRPLIPDEHRFVDGWAARRVDLKPGITGIWQVLGRDDIPFGEMVGLDYRYVTTWSLSQDLQLLLRTLPVVVGSERST